MGWRQMVYRYNKLSRQVYTDLPFIMVRKKFKLHYQPEGTGALNQSIDQSVLLFAA